MSTKYDELGIADEAMKVLIAWREEYKRWHKHDVAPHITVLERHELKFDELPEPGISRETFRRYHVSPEFAKDAIALASLTKALRDNKLIE